MKWLIVALLVMGLWGCEDGNPSKPGNDKDTTSVNTGDNPFIGSWYPVLDTTDLEWRDYWRDRWLAIERKEMWYTFHSNGTMEGGGDTYTYTEDGGICLYTEEGDQFCGNYVFTKSGDSLRIYDSFGSMAPWMIQDRDKAYTHVMDTSLVGKFLGTWVEVFDTTDERAKEYYACYDGACELSPDTIDVYAEDSLYQTMRRSSGEPVQYWYEYDYDQICFLEPDGNELDRKCYPYVMVGDSLWFIDDLSDLEEFWAPPYVRVDK
jgi:hypothetical protein